MSKRHRKIKEFTGTSAFMVSPEGDMDMSARVSKSQMKRHRRKLKHTKYSYLDDLSR